MATASKAVAQRIPNVTLFDVTIKWPNFSGLEGTYNAAGNRNFAIFLDPEKAEELERMGYPVKYLQSREEGEPMQAMLKIKVKYSERAKPPKIVMINSRGQLELPEDMIGILDWADIEKADIIIRAYQWEFNNKTGVTAYANTVYATIREDELEQKYANVPIDSARSALTGGDGVFEGELEDMGEQDERFAIEAGR